MKQPLAVALAAFAANLRFSQLPQQAMHVAKSGIADCIGVAIAGSQEPPVQILRRALMESAGHGVATVLGARDGIRTTAAEAAWINGAAGHVLDYDDVARGHPSVVIVPAILALAEERDTIEDVIEPFLIQQGLIQRTPRGRVISDAGYKQMGLTAPRRDPAQFNLLDAGDGR